MHCYLPLRMKKEKKKISYKLPPKRKKFEGHLVVFFEKLAMMYIIPYRTFPKIEYK